MSDHRPTIRVLVVIPTAGNRDRTLGEALRSVDGQTRPADEVRVAGGESPFLARLNGAIAASDCEAFIVLCDDDLLDPSYIEKTARSMEETGADIVYTDRRNFTDDGREETIAQTYPPVTSLCRKSMWQKVGGYSEFVNFDLVFWLKAKACGAQAVRVEEPLFYYQVRS